MNRLMEFSNQSSLDKLNIHIRWLKEWQFTHEDLVQRREANHISFLFPYTAIWLVLDGEAEIELNRENYRVRTGDIVCISPQMMLTWKAIRSEESFHYLSFACEATIGIFDFIRLYRVPSVVSSCEKNCFLHLTHLWRQLAAEYKQFLLTFESEDLKTHDKRQIREYPSFTLNTDQTILHLMLRSGGLKWMKELFLALRHTLPHQPVAYDTRVFEICRHIENHVQTPPSLEEMAAMAALSKEQLRTLFQTVLGLSPVRYVRHVRLQRAKDLLAFTALSIKEIAIQTGFEDQHHFSRAFRHNEGASPLAYRRRHKK